MRMRKKWVQQTEVTTKLLSSREKRKWQIALRRYVLEKNPSFFYAPYFGLDIKNMRKWFEGLFTEGMSWDNFGKTWQFDHVIPVIYFDYTKEEDLRLCWNFLNLHITSSKSRQSIWSDQLNARTYFEHLYQSTHFPLCEKFINKINSIEEAAERFNLKSPREFILENRHYLATINHYSAYEFDLLNNGKKPEEIIKEMAFLKKFES